MALQYRFVANRSRPHAMTQEPTSPADATAEPGGRSTVAAWLGTLGLGRYARLFDEHHIDIDLLVTLSAADLRWLGVGSSVDCRRLLQGIGSMAAAEGRRQRTRLTVLYCDLVDSTALSVVMHPSALADV